MTTTNTPDTQAGELLPCPWCEAVPQKTDLAPSQRFRLDHKPDCYLAGRMTEMRGNSRYIFIPVSQIQQWNTRADLPRAVAADDEIRLHLAERVARAALLFCDEVSEDSEDIPQFQLKELNMALDAWEPSLELPDGPFDDTQPALAALQSLLSDPHATDAQRRIAQLAYQVINNHEIETDNEIRRWQDAIRDKMIAMGVPDSLIDGAGCDSGDPLDFTLAEVGQGVGYFPET